MLTPPQWGLVGKDFFMPPHYIGVVGSYATPLQGGKGHRHPSIDRHIMGAMGNGILQYTATLPVCVCVCVWVWVWVWVVTSLKLPPGCDGLFISLPHSTGVVSSGTLQHASTIHAGSG